jgi:hypothetical protein
MTIYCGKLETVCFTLCCLFFPHLYSVEPSLLIALSRLCTIVTVDPLPIGYRLTNHFFHAPKLYIPSTQYDASADHDDFDGGMRSAVTVSLLATSSLLPVITSL